jgi:TQXA domain-containing protein
MSHKPFGSLYLDPRDEVEHHFKKRKAKTEFLGTIPRVWDKAALSNIHVDGEDAASKRGFLIAGSDGVYPNTVDFQNLTTPAYVITNNPKLKLADFSDEMKCAVSWIIANGFAIDSDMDEFNKAFETEALSELDAYIATQTAVWMASGELELVSPVFAKPDASSAAADAVNKVAMKLYETALEFSRSGFCDYVLRGEVAAKRSYTRLSPYFNENVMNGPECCGLPTDFRLGCRADQQDIMICAEDTPGSINNTPTSNVQWHYVLSDIRVRVVCGRLLIGPFSVDFPSSGKLMVTGSRCGCKQDFGYEWADSCGKNTAPPTSGQEFYLKTEITGKHVCFNICVERKHVRTRVAFSDRADDGVTVGTRDYADMKRWSSCMCICVEVPTIEDPPEPPKPVPPIYYPRMKRPDPRPPLPPEIVNMPPIILPPDRLPAPPPPPTPDVPVLMPLEQMQDWNVVGTSRACVDGSYKYSPPFTQTQVLQKPPIIVSTPPEPRRKPNVLPQPILMNPNRPRPCLTPVPQPAPIVLQSLPQRQPPPEIIRQPAPPRQVRAPEPLFPPFGRLPMTAPRPTRPVVIIPAQQQSMPPPPQTFIIVPPVPPCPPPKPKKKKPVCDIAC